MERKLKFRSLIPKSFLYTSYVCHKRNEIIDEMRGIDAASFGFLTSSSERVRNQSQFVIVQSMVKVERKWSESLYAHEVLVLFPHPNSHSNPRANSRQRSSRELTHIHSENLLSSEFGSLAFEDWINSRGSRSLSSIFSKKFNIIHK